MMVQSKSLKLPVNNVHQHEIYDKGGDAWTRCVWDWCGIFLVLFCFALLWDRTNDQRKLILSFHWFGSIFLSADSTTEKELTRKIDSEKC